MSENSIKDIEAKVILANKLYKLQQTSEWKDIIEKSYFVESSLSLVEMLANSPNENRQVIYDNLYAISSFKIFTDFILTEGENAKRSLDEYAKGNYK